MKHISQTLGKSFLLALIAVSPFAALAEEGGAHGGGGDPVAAEFTFTMLKIGTYLDQHADVLPEIDRAKMTGLLTTFKLSLDAASKVEVVESRPKDPSGVLKAAVFSTRPLGIKIHRQTWQQSASKEQVTLAAMEILGLTGVKEDRYGKALQQLGENADSILSSSRKDEVTRAFVRLSRDPKSAVALKISRTRKTFESSTSNCGAGTVPAIATPLSMSSIESSTETSEVYAGKFTGDESHSEWEGGYENWDFTLAVPVQSCSYGGHITTTNALKFECVYKSERNGSGPKWTSKIECKSTNSVDPN